MREGDRVILVREVPPGSYGGVPGFSLGQTGTVTTAPGTVTFASPSAAVARGMVPVKFDIGTGPPHGDWYVRREDLDYLTPRCPPCLVRRFSGGDSEEVSVVWDGIPRSRVLPGWYVRVVPEPHRPSSYR